MRKDLADQRDVFFFYLAVTSYVNSMSQGETGEDVDNPYPPIFFIAWAMSGSVIRTFADECLLASNLGISFSQAIALG